VRLALECPANLLEEVQPLGDFDFILAHLVLGDSSYADYYRRSTRLKILDNSTNELLRPCTLDEIGKADSLVGPCDFIVAPDFLWDSKATIEALPQTVARFRFDRVIPVVQGDSLEETLGCASYYWSLGFRRMAVPYSLLTKPTDSVGSMAKARGQVVFRLEFKFSLELRLHLLGMTTLEELHKYRSSRVVESVDTGSPVLHGLRNLRFGRDQLLEKSLPTLNQMPTKYGSDQVQDVFYNIAYLRRFTGDW